MDFSAKSENAAVAVLAGIGLYVAMKQSYRLGRKAVRTLKEKF